MSEGVDLKVVLLAKGLEVAASNDPQIWLSTMALITGVPSVVGREDPAVGKSPLGAESPKTDSNDLVSKLAADLGVSRNELEGAAGPSNEPPYIHLDHKYWEALKSNKGYGRVPPSALAATLLLLWDRYAKIGDITIASCGAVLKTVDLTTKNAARAFKNCEWLQLRGNTIKLNPAMISKAESLAAAYCQRGAK